MTRSRTTQPADWLHHHGDVLYAYALRRVAEPACAEDMVQETLLAAWRTHDRFRGDATERTWLIGILKHKCSDELRRRQRQGHHCDGNADDVEAAVFQRNGSWAEPPADWGRNPLGATEAEALTTALSTCVDSLPDAQRSVFLLREIDGLDTDHASKQLGISSNYLFVLMHRARLRLRRCLERTGVVKEGPS